jgi:hypothetical protein
VPVVVSAAAGFAETATATSREAVSNRKRRVDFFIYILLKICKMGQAKRII